MTRCLVLSTAFALALAAGGTISAEPAPGTGPSGTGITALAWLSGCWRGPAGEECWLEPGRAGMLGVSRGPVDGGEAPSFEFLRIVEDDGALVYLASPGGRCPPTPFRSVEVGDGRVVFANPEHDFPQRIIYDGREAGVLVATIEGPRGGETARMGWRMRRVACGGEAESG